MAAPERARGKAARSGAAPPPRRRAAKRRKARTWEGVVLLNPRGITYSAHIDPHTRYEIGMKLRAIRVRITELLPARRKAPR